MKNKNQLNPRQTAILNQIRSQGRVTVEDLADVFATTPQTVRKDLQALADAHEVVRFHGGAYLLSGIEYTTFETRQNIAQPQKRMIGEAIAKRIPNNSTVMINAGTTTAAAADALRHHVGLKVITDNVNLANRLREFSGIETMVPGGVVRRSDGALLGGAAVDFIRQFRADIAIIGAAAIAGDGALLDYDLREAQVARAIVGNSHHVILAADSSKFERSAPVQIGHLSQVHTLVTDRFDSTNLRALCEESEIELIVAPVEK